MSRSAGFVLVAAALVGCGGKSAGPAGPSNNADAPPIAAVSDDELAYLPADAEIVVGIDAAAMRSSALWTKFEPQIVSALGDKLQQVTTMCGFDPLRQIERAAAGGKIDASEQFDGVVVVRGVSGAKTLECLAKASEGQGKVTTQNGVMTLDGTGSDKLSATIVGSNTLVMRVGSGASSATLDAALRGGAALRSSAAFMALFERREAGASVWGMVNGNSRLLGQMSEGGVKPASVDGTLVLEDKFYVSGRMTFRAAADADSLAKQVQAFVPMVQDKVEKIEIAAKGEVVQANLIATDEQVRQLMGMVGMF